MKISQLLLYIGLAILGFWLLGFVLELAKWAIDIALIIGLILVIVSLLNQYYESKHKTNVK